MRGIKRITFDQHFFTDLHTVAIKESAAESNRRSAFDLPDTFGFEKRKTQLFRRKYLPLLSLLPKFQRGLSGMDRALFRRLVIPADEVVKKFAELLHAGQFFSMSIKPVSSGVPSAGRAAQVIRKHLVKLLHDIPESAFNGFGSAVIRCGILKTDAQFLKDGVLISLHFQRSGKSLCTVIFAVVEVGNGRGNASCIVTIQGKGVDQSVRVDRLNRDPVGGKVPGPGINECGDCWTDRPPFLSGIIPDAYTGIKGAAVADNTESCGDT